MLFSRTNSEPYSRFATCKGKDLLSRIPAENRIVIPPMSFGDRVLIVLSQFAQAGHELGHEINFVEKLCLYYVAPNERLSNARQLHEFAVWAVERVPRGMIASNTITYLHQVILRTNDFGWR
jgi:hypothetical protein